MAVFSSERNRRRRGSAIVEAALLMPWIAFLFIGVLDFGFYAYQAISLENAVRVAALHNAIGGVPDQSTACIYVLREMTNVPNIGTTVTSCDASPLTVTASSATVAGNANAIQVTAVYNGVSMIPLPTLMGKYSVTRSAWAEAVPKP